MRADTLTTGSFTEDTATVIFSMSHEHQFCSYTF